MHAKFSKKTEKFGTVVTVVTVVPLRAELSLKCCLLQLGTGGTGPQKMLTVSLK